MRMRFVVSIAVLRLRCNDGIDKIYEVDIPNGFLSTQDCGIIIHSGRALTAAPRRHTPHFDRSKKPRIAQSTMIKL